MYYPSSLGTMEKYRFVLVKYLVLFLVVYKRTLHNTSPLLNFCDSSVIREL